ncbi:MAG: aminotransferase class III [Gammaproteobacteria bacterium]|nr:aminotransferase class III [Gammaproteobacteria bacterium]|tara:strand:+ start:549 stop:1883 length:1335 start_codon:yes stop_codon:yes gene_type:complete
MKNFGNRQLTKGSGQLLYKRAKQIIPGGTQLLSKRPEMFAPNIWPAYYSKAKGSKLWDLDGNEYIDMSIMGIGSNILGYADKDVDNQVLKAIKNSVSSTLNCPEEVELAELLIKIHPWADMVRYTRSGGEACAMAIRISRAATKRDKILFSGYHGWSDWYLASNLGDTDALDGQLMSGLEPRGVPRSLKNTAIPFHFNNIDELKMKSKDIKNEIAAIIVEPARGIDAPRDYLVSLKEFSNQIGAVLIFDEITSGFRMCVGGLHIKYGIEPDIAIFAKSMANGYAMAAIIGTENIMNAAQSTFISSTNWTERIGPVAAIATINKYIKNQVQDYIIKIGNQVKNIWEVSAEKYGLSINISGLPTLGSFSFNNENNQAMMTYFTIAMLDRGILGYRQFKPSYAHKKKDIDKYSMAVDQIFKILSENDISELLKSDIAHSSFARLTSE